MKKKIGYRMNSTGYLNWYLAYFYDTLTSRRNCPPSGSYDFQLQTSWIIFKHVILRILLLYQFVSFLMLIFSRATNSATLQILYNCKFPFDHTSPNCMRIKTDQISLIAIKNWRRGLHVFSSHNNSVYGLCKIWHKKTLMA